MLSIRAIAVWEVLGGLLIATGNAIALTQPGTLPLPYHFLASSFGVAVLAFVAGVALWRRSSIGLPLSLGVQVLQFAWISLPSVAFGSTLGPTAGLRLTSTMVTASVGFYGRGGLLVLPSDSAVSLPLDITVNVLAMIAFVVLLREYRRRSQVRIDQEAGSGIHSSEIEV